QAPVTIPATVAPTTTEHPGDAAVAAYHASWAAYVAAAQIPDPYHPGLAETMTGPSLQRVRDGFESRRVSGRASRFPGPREVQASYRTVRDGRAVLNVCYVDDEVVYVKATGQVVNDEVITQYMEVEMAFLDGRWKRFDTIGLEEKQGRVPCAS
ncbi:MAG: hypothetical protein ACRD0M_10730, partial [Acidimicrobiales bacterium]